jgi:hypothetical protein
MSLHIKIRRDAWGTWSVHGLSSVPVSDLPSLSASIDYARNACNAAPTTIELYVDGMYIVAHQERGWPKALVASKRGRCDPVPTGPDQPDRGRTALWSRLAAWLRRARHSSTEPGPASLAGAEGVECREPQANLKSIRQLSLHPPWVTERRASTRRLNVPARVPNSIASTIAIPTS